MAYGDYMEDLTSICTKVWQCKNLKDKRNLLKRAVKTFKYHCSDDYFFKIIEAADEMQCDVIASNLILNKKHKVVKPRSLIC